MAVTVRVVVGGTVVVVTDLGRAFAGDKPHAPFEKERSSIAMSPYILLPTIPSMITCRIFESFYCQKSLSYSWLYQNEAVLIKSRI